MYSIEMLSEDNAPQWEKYNNNSREGTLYHSIRWKKILEDVLRLRLRYYLILEEQRIVGICPFAEQQAGHLRGLTDIPHSEFSNIILDDTFDIDRIDEILSLFAKDYAFLNITTYNPAILSKITYDNYPVENTGNMILDLEKNAPDRIWKDLFSARDRKNIRRFEREEFQIREIRQRREIDIFYQYYLQNMKHINGKILPISFFLALLDSYSPKNVRIVTLTHADAIAGGSLVLSDPIHSTANFEHLAINRAFSNRYTPTLYINWESINWAMDNGYRKISFGRQKLDPDNSRFQKKAKFGAEFVPIHSRLVFFSKSVSLLYRLRTGLTGG